MEDINSWLPLAGVVVGWGLTYFSGGRRERENRRKDRQYTTITEAQDLIVQRLHLIRGISFALDNGEVWETLYPESDRFQYHREEVTKSAEIAWRLIALGSRIEDEKLSSLLSQFVDESSSATDQDDREVREEARAAAFRTMRLFNYCARTVLADLN